MSAEWQRFESAGTVGWKKGSGPQLAMVLHGGPGLSEYTAALCDEVLAGGDGNLRVARYQQRGAPPSTLEGPITVAQLVEDALGVLDHLDASRALLVGHSWGAHLAMHFAVAHPERTAGLLLLDALGAVGDGGTGTMQSVIGSRLTSEAHEALAGLAARDELDPDERAAIELEILWPGYFKDPGCAPPYPGITVHSLAGSVMDDAIRLLSTGALERSLPSLRVPSLHVIGMHSPIEPAANERTANLLRDSIIEWQDAGHFAWLEAPGSVERATRRLLERIVHRCGVLR